MRMLKYILKRIGLMIMTFAIIMVLCFVLIKLLPFNINVGVGQDAAQIEEVIKERGYRDPIMKQLWNYILRIVTQGDFGQFINLSEESGPVWDTFIQKLPATVLINVYATLIAVPTGILLGILAAVKKNKWQDHVISILVILVISVPSYVYGFLVQYILCYKLKLFDITMKGGTNYFSLPMFRSMIPAVLCLSFGSIAGYARYTRAELTEVLTSEYMLLAEAKGLTRRQATMRHALRNAMVPIFPSIVGEFVAVLSGSLVIESIFSIPVVGNLYIRCIDAQDYDGFMLLSGFYIFIGLAATILIDLSYGIIDPRIRMGEK